MPTLIVRLWSPAPEVADELLGSELHGSVERVGEEGTSHFRSTLELVSILEAVVAEQRRVASTD